MKAIIKAFSPKKCEKIFNGEMTIDVCKTAPKLDPPFKVYVYRTKDKVGKAIVNKVLNGVYGGGKVIGEFVCDKVIKYGYDVISCAKFEVNGAYVEEAKRYNAGACLSAEEMYEYSNGKPLYGWYITAPKLYDKPKELSEFRKPDFFRDCERDCRKNCDMEYYRCPTRDSHKASAMAGYCRKKGKNLTRPPQSFMYVEEIEE